MYANLLQCDLDRQESSQPCSPVLTRAGWLTVLNSLHPGSPDNSRLAVDSPPARAQQSKRPQGPRHCWHTHEVHERCVSKLVVAHHVHQMTKVMGAT